MSDHRNHVPPAPRRHESHDSPPRCAARTRNAPPGDEDLRDDILKCLEKADFDAGELSVHISNGMVTLKGKAEARFKSRVLDLIGGCGGLVTDSEVNWH